VYYDCDYFDWDDGDCEAESDGDGSSDDDGAADDDGGDDDGSSGDGIGATCDYTGDSDGVIDCSGDCVSYSTAMSWMGDGYCDGVDESYGYHLDCSAFSFDGGDCG